MALLIIHVPGGWTYAATDGEYTGILAGGDYPAIGISLTAIGIWSFIGGLALTERRLQRRPAYLDFGASPERHKFTLYCLLCGWFLAFGTASLSSIPTLGAAIVFGSSIWMLGVMQGLRRALHKQDWSKVAAWVVALLVHPLIILMFGGFLSYGSTAVIIVVSFLLCRFRERWLVLFFVPFMYFIGISVFVNYFDDRTSLRNVVWSGAGFEQRINSIFETFSDFNWFDSSNPEHLNALAQRLNQNEFVGLAYERLKNDQVEYLEGKSFYEGMVSLIPRAIWREKPVYGGSPAIVGEMTGLKLSQTSSWGVGNVMEFYINFGYTSLICAYVVLGFIIGWLDIRTFRALNSLNFQNSMPYFLAGAALIQPNGSLVELVGGSVSAFFAGQGMLWVWNSFLAHSKRDDAPSMVDGLPPRMRH